MRMTVGTTCIVMAASVLFAACEPEPPEASVQEVVVELARMTTFPIYGNFVAITKASRDVEVRARVNGFVEGIDFQEGSFVAEGAPLYSIDDRPYRAKVNRLEANRKSAEAQLAKATRDVDRLQPLYEQNAASQLDLDTATSTKEQADANIAAIDAELAEAELELSFTRVIAPISGLIGASNVDIGALVGNEGQSLLTSVKKVDPMFVEFRMSALDYLNAQRRRKSFEERKEAEVEGRAVEGWVRITMPDDTLYRYRGDISFTEPQVSPETGTFAVRAVVPNPNRELLPGQYTRVRLELEAIHDAIIIDERSLRIEQGGSYVMVVLPDHTVEQRFIVLGPQRDHEIVVDSGLAKDEMVIVEGMHRVRHGQTVSPIEEAAYRARQEEAGQ